MRRPALFVASLLLSGSLAAADPEPALDLGHLGTRSNIALLQGPGYPGSAQDLYLEVYLNGVRVQRVLHVAVDTNGRQFAWPPNLRDAGLRVAINGQAGDEDYVAIDALSGIGARYDAPNQRLYFDTDASRLNLRSQRYGRAETPTWPATIDPGVLLNYDSYATFGEVGNTLAIGHALRGFSELGVIESTGLSSFNDYGADSRAYVRLDSSWSRQDPDALNSLSVGDFIAGGLSWSRAMRMGGVQLRRNFGLQPGLLTYPIPQFFGQATLPSRLELYVDGIRQFESTTPPGPFEIVTPPSINGAGQAVVVLTDALGRSQSFNFDFYNANRLLREGLSDYSASLGVLRRNYGLESFDYRDEIASVLSGAYGLDDRLTVEGHAELGESVQLSGLGLIARVGDWGTARGNAGYSSARRRVAHGRDEGIQYGYGYNLTVRHYHFDYSLQRSSDGYADLATAEGQPPSRYAEQALAGAGFGNFNISVSYVRLETADAERYRGVGLQGSGFLHEALSLYAGLNYGLDADELSIFAGLSWSFASRISAGVTASDGDGGSSFDAYVDRALPIDGGYGWSLRGGHGRDSDRLQGEGAYRGRYGTLRGGLQRLNSDTSAYASAAGAAVFMGRSLMFTREASNGFALVDTNGIGGVPVLLENRPVGTTDASGHYLVTQINPYQPNRISIDPLHLPAEIQTSHTTLQAVPADRSGLILDFGLRRTRSALLVLHDASGRAIDVGSMVMRDGERDQVVGFDGQIYLENLQPRNRLQVVRSDGGECSVRFDYPADASGIPSIGPLRCLP